MKDVRDIPDIWDIGRYKGMLRDVEDTEDIGNTGSGKKGNIIGYKGI